MVGQATLVEELQAIVGPEHARPPDTTRFTVDGMSPSAVVMPGSYEEVAGVMRFANGRGLAVIPQGHGAVTWIGNIPRRYDIALSVSRLNKIVEYEPADLTITTQAGATLEDLYGPLSDSGQILPFAQRPVSDCIGRLLALPLEGSTLARDATIGMRVVTADGRITRCGGKVVKNVAGYDLCKLHIGAMGTLGVIVEATFKLAPAPQAEERVETQFPTLADACNAASELRRRGLSLSRVKLSRPMSLTDEGASPYPFFWLTVELAGTFAAVARSRAEVAEVASSAGGTLEVTRIPPRPEPLPDWTNGGDPLTCRASVLPTAVPSLTEAVDRDVPGAFLEGSPITGSTSMTWLGAGPDEARVNRVRAITSGLGGSVTVTGCDIELKRRIDVFGEPPPAFELMRSVKQQFDPNGILNPGRFVGRL